MGEALACTDKALDLARASKRWLRHVLYTRCRIAVEAKRYDLVEAAMEEILSDWPCRCEIDIPMFEWD